LKKKKISSLFYFNLNNVMMKFTQSQKTPPQLSKDAKLTAFTFLYPPCIKTMWNLFQKSSNETSFNFAVQLHGRTCLRSHCSINQSNDLPQHICMTRIEDEVTDSVALVFKFQEHKTCHAHSIVAFRPTASIANWISNINIAKQPWLCHSRVHAGFLKQWNSILPQLRHALIEKTPISLVGL
jgi:hypothetical protein